MVDVKKEVLDREFAGFWIRLAAFAVDFVILILISIVAAILFVSVSRFSRVEFDVEVISGFAGFLINAGYYIFMTYRYGATVGKKVFGLRVESIKEDKMDIGIVIVREVAGKFISSMFLGLGYLWILLDKKNQGLHDKLSSTVVVKVGKKIPTWRVYTVAVFFLVIVGGFCAWVMDGVFDEEFQEQLDREQVAIIVSKTLNASKLCVSEGNNVEDPISVLGGGDVCSDPIGTSWPKIGAGYQYEEVGNDSFFVTKNQEKIFECNIDKTECIFVQ